MFFGNAVGNKKSVISDGSSVQAGQEFRLTIQLIYKSIRAQTEFES